MGVISLDRYFPGEHNDVHFLGAKSFCETVGAKKDAKTRKRPAGKRCTIFGGDFSLTPLLPEPMDITRPSTTTSDFPAGHGDLYRGVKCAQTGPGKYGSYFLGEKIDHRVLLRSTGVRKSVS